MNAKSRLSPAQVERRHKIELSVSLVLYAIVLVGSIEFLKQEPPAAARIALALAPVVPIVLVIWSSFRHITSVDELQRRIHTESLAIAAGGTAFFGLTYSFLEGDAGFPHLPAWWAWVSIGFIWAVASLVLRRHYR
ncbi:MAG TPA: hypothetical protein VFK96_05320 [Gammaproteobacteria bacterium]|nr:hypothetical protein [Gammaproteobacteria bacterium]